MNFITQVSSSRSWPVFVQAKNIEYYHPESTHYIYDGGLDKKTIDKLGEFETVKIIDWTGESNFPMAHGNIKSLIAKMEDKIKNVYTDHILHKLGLGFYFSELMRWNFYIKQKPKVILDLSTRTDGKMIWLDDDAIPIGKIDDIFDYDFDIGITIRSKYDERRHSGSSVNSGVIFFNTTSENILKFAQRWLDLIEATKPTFDNPNVEQDMLEYLLLETNQNMTEGYYCSDMIKINNIPMQIRTFPCKIYNHINFESGIDPNTNRIVHFKDGKLSEELHKELLSDIERGKIHKWTRKKCDS